MDAKSKLVLISIAILLLIEQGLALQCLECNVWKAGYGHLCTNPRIRDDCEICMKTETTIFMGYYKNSPRSSTTISRICGKSKTVHFSHECHYYSSADGHSSRCYCKEDMCNSSPALHHSSIASAAVISLTLTWALQKLL